VLSKDTSSGACSILYVVVVVVVVVVFDVLVVVFGVPYQNSLFLSATVKVRTDIMSQKIECVVCGFCLSHLQLRPDGRTQMPDGPTDGQKCLKVFYSSMD
jgi:hypothetical protein